MTDVNDKSRLAHLAVEVGANVQPGQLVEVHTEVGQVDMARAVAAAAYQRGARFVDVQLFDPLIQRERLLWAPDDALKHIPRWQIERMRELGDERAASIKITGPSAPHAFDDVAADRVGRASLPEVPQWREIELLVNWTVIASATPEWAHVVYPERPDDALAQLTRDLAFVYRLDADDPADAWRRRVEELTRLADALTARALDRVRLVGPGTDLEVGLLPGARWAAPTMVSAAGIEHLPNIPTEEVFTVPDPERVDGVVRLTRSAVVAGRRVDGVTLRFRAGRVTDVDGPPGADALRAYLRRDAGASRLGELALVDSSSRVAQLNRRFGVILLDENAASHVALGFGFPELVAEDVRGRVNDSEVHLDVMVGSPEVAVTGVDASGDIRPLLDGGRWVGGLAD